MVGSLWLEGGTTGGGKRNPKPNPVKLAVKKMRISPTVSLLIHVPGSESCRASGAEAGSSSALEHGRGLPAKSCFGFVHDFGRGEGDLGSQQPLQGSSLCSSVGVAPRTGALGFWCSARSICECAENPGKGAAGGGEGTPDPSIHPLGQKAPAELPAGSTGLSGEEWGPRRGHPCSEHGFPTDPFRMEKPSKANQSNFPQLCQGHH